MGLYQQQTDNIYFKADEIPAALACMQEVGYCVIRQLIGPDLVQALKDSIDEHLDPHRDLPPASNRYHMMFAEASEPLWEVVQQPGYRRYIQQVHGTDDLCLHRSAAILRTPGEGMGIWHSDHRGHVQQPQNANEVLNRYPIPSGSWFYLNGSHPDRSGIAVIEKSHLPGWEGPDGFALSPDRNTFYRLGESPDNPCRDMDVPGCIPVVADPGDLICFADLTFHANMATQERRYSCGIGFRPKAWRIDAPWPLPQTAKEMIARLPAHLQTYTDGYTGYDGSWKADG